jgi:type IV fimbrial biogenesis protein FimT
MPNGLKPIRSQQLPRPEQGFTLLELMMVLLVSSILAMLALPAMQQFLQNQRISSAATELITGLNYARSEAIKEDVAVTGGGGVQLCASTGSGANPTCDSANWATGWIVLSSTSPVPLQLVGALQSPITLTTTPVNAAVAFQPNGTAPTLSVAGNGRIAFKLCDARGAQFAREVEVNLAGIIQASTVPGQDVSGAALTCP